MTETAVVTFYRRDIGSSSVSVPGRTCFDEVARLVRYLKPETKVLLHRFPDRERCDGWLFEVRR